MNTQSYLESIRQTRSKGTHTAYAYSLGLFESQCRKPVSEIQGSDLSAFAAARRQAGDSERTVHNHLLRVSIFLRASGVELPFRKFIPKAANRVPEEYSVKQVTEMLRIADGRDKLILEVFLCAGLRNKELANLEKSDIDFEASTIRIRVKENWKPKSGHEREIAIPRWLTEKMSSARSGLLFPNSVGGPDTNLLRVVKDVASRAGITGRVDAHKWRSTSVCQMLRSGFSLADVMATVGHKDLSTTQRYLAVANRQKMQAMSEKAFAAISGD